MIDTTIKTALMGILGIGQPAGAPRKPTGAEKRKLTPQDVVNHRIYRSEWKRWRKQQKRHECYCRSIANNPCLNVVQKEKMLYAAGAIP